MTRPAKDESVKKFGRLACSLSAPMALSALLAPAAGAQCASTSTARTPLDAIEVMSSQLGLNSSKAVQDHFYDGNPKGGLTGGAVYAQPAGAPAAPVAKFTAQAQVYKPTPGKVPPLKADAEAAAKPAADSAQASLSKAAVSVAKAPAAEAKAAAAKPATPPEIEAARTVFGNKIDYSKVKIITGKDMTLWGRILTWNGKAVVWGNKIYFPNDKNGNSKFDFSKNPGWYMHEMTHVYQFQNRGWGYVPKSLWDQLTKGSEGAYDYQLVPGKAFKDYGIEQQADIVRDYYNGVNGRNGLTPAELAALRDTLQGEGLAAGSKP